MEAKNSDRTRPRWARNALSIENWLLGMSLIFCLLALVAQMRG